MVCEYNGLPGDEKYLTSTSEGNLRTFSTASMLINELDIYSYARSSNHIIFRSPEFEKLIFLS